MPGWRIGFMVGNQKLVGALARLKSYFDYGTFTPIQVASIAALEGPQECVAQICDNYRRRRDVLVEGLNKAGWAVAKPRATMFVWAEIPEAYRDLKSLEFSKLLLERGQDRRLARDRLWRLRRQPRPLRAHRERGADEAGIAGDQGNAGQGRCAGLTRPIHPVTLPHPVQM